jgi:uncharacterized protein
MQMIGRWFFRSIWALGFVAWLFALSLPAWGEFAESIPNPRQVDQGWVSDTAEVLSPKAETRINQAISELQRQNGAEIAVVTIKALPNDQSAKELAIELFNAWGIGEEDADNGLLFLVAVNNRRVEVETGYGTEAVLNDARVGRILDQQVIPRFRAGEMEAGIVAGTEAFVAVLSHSELHPEPRGPSTGVGIGVVALLAGLGAALLGRHLDRLTNSPLSLAPVGYTRTSSDAVLPKRFHLFAAASGLMALISLMALLLVMVSPAMPTAATLLIVVGLPLAPFILYSAEKKYARRVGRARRLRQLAFCRLCGAQMQSVSPDVLAQYLSPPQLAAQKLGSVSFSAWKCNSCHAQRILSSPGREDQTSDLHLIAYEQPTSYQRCPICHQKAVTTGKTVASPSFLSLLFSPVELHINKRCLACGHEEQDIQLIVSDSDGSSDSHDSGSHGGGGSFGGGSSGGGGAGRNW